MGNPMRFARLVVALWLTMNVGAFAQQQLPPAPVPAALASAKKVFISNLGTDGISYQGFQQPKMPYEPYNSFYQAMQRWGHFELVQDPSAADLVLEIQLSTRSLGAEKRGLDPSQLTLKVFDGKSHYVLWTVVEPFNLAIFASNRKKDMLNAVNDLMEQWKAVVGAAQS